MVLKVHPFLCCITCSAFTSVPTRSTCLISISCRARAHPCPAVHGGPNTSFIILASSRQVPRPALRAHEPAGITPTGQRFLGCVMPAAAPPADLVRPVYCFYAFFTSGGLLKAYSRIEYIRISLFSYLARLQAIFFLCSALLVTVTTVLSAPFRHSSRRAVLHSHCPRKK